jgi:hypothetical protein
MSGQVMLSGLLVEISGLIEVSSLPTGVYILKLHNQSVTEFRKFIKQ